MCCGRRQRKCGARGNAPAGGNVRGMAATERCRERVRGVWREAVAGARALAAAARQAGKGASGASLVRVEGSGEQQRQCGGAGRWSCVVR